LEACLSSRNQQMYEVVRQENQKHHWKSGTSLALTMFAIAIDP
jgi:hypothetical protein